MFIQVATYILFIAQRSKTYRLSYFIHLIIHDISKTLHLRTLNYSFIPRFTYFSAMTFSSASFLRLTRSNSNVIRETLHQKAKIHMFMTNNERGLGIKILSYYWKEREIISGVDSHQESPSCCQISRCYVPPTRSRGTREIRLKGQAKGSRPEIFLFANNLRHVDICVYMAYQMFHLY